MPDWLITLLQTVTPSLLVGILLAIWTAKQNRHIQVQNERQNTAKRKDSLQISLLVATAELTYAIAMAIKRGTPNGEVETAIKRYNIAMEKFRTFERERLYDD